MVYRAIVHNKDATWARVRIHVLRATLEVFEKGIAIVCAELYVTVDDAVLGKRWENGVPVTPLSA
jgi:hypothetical protein